MTPTEIRTAVRGLQAQGHSLREISRLLALSRNTVRRILRAPAGNVCRDAAVRRGHTGPAESRLRPRPRQCGPGARTAGGRWSRRCLQHLDPLGQGGRPAWAAATRWRIQLRAGPGDAARHLAAPGEVCVNRQTRQRAMCRAGAGLLAPAVHPVLPALHPLRGQGVPARGGSFHGMASARSVSSTTPAFCSPPAPAPTPSSRRRWRPSLAPSASGSAHTGSDIPTEKAGSNVPLPMSRTNFLAAPRLRGSSTTSIARRSPGAATSPTDKPKQALGMSAEAAYLIERPHLVPLPEAIAAGLRVAGTRRRSARLCLGRNQPLFRPRALRRQVGRRLQDCRPRSRFAARTPRSPCTAG